MFFKRIISFFMKIYTQTYEEKITYANMCLKRLKKVVYLLAGFLKAPKKKKTSIKYVDESFLFTSNQLSSCIFFNRRKICG